MLLTVRLFNPPNAQEDFRFLLVHRHMPQSQAVFFGKSNM